MILIIIDNNTSIKVNNSILILQYKFNVIWVS